MRILAITTESQVYRDLTYKRRKIKKLTQVEANPIYDEKRAFFTAPDEYKGVAKKIFLGRLSEVIGLYEELMKGSYDTKLAILSSAYGVIHPNDVVTPYWTNDGKLHVCSIPDEIINLITQTDLIVLILDIINLQWLFNQIEHLLNSKKIIVISAGSLKQETTFNNVDLYLSTKGVARIGKDNKKILLEWLKNNTTT